jgi:hypothetical protein
MIYLLLASVLMSMFLPSFRSSFASVTETQTYVEGDHVRFYLTDTATNSIPDITINSTWASIIPAIDGIVNTFEWNDAFKTVIYGFDQPSPLYVKNNNDTFYLAVIVPSDQSNNTDMLSVYFYPNGGYNKFYLPQHPTVDLFSNGTTKTNLLNGLSWNTTFTAEGRAWELSIPVVDLSITDPNYQCNIELYPSDGVNTPTEYSKPHWPAFINGAQILWGNMGLARSASQNGEGITFLTLMRDMVTLFDEGYENLSRLFRYTPYSGQKISIRMDSSLYGTGVAAHSGNPIVVATVTTNAQGVFHELTHDFVTVRACHAIDEAIPNTVQTILDSALTKPTSQKDMLIRSFDQMPLEDNYCKSILNNYEAKGAPFSEIDLNSEAGMVYFKSMLRYLVYTYGWETLSGLSIYRGSNTQTLDVWYPNDSSITHRINLWIYTLSLGAGIDLTSLFKDKWHFPLFSGSPFPCAISCNGENYWITINTDRLVDINTLNFDPSSKQIRFQTLVGPLGGYCNVTIPQILLRQNGTSAWNVTIDNALTEYSLLENQTHAVIGFDFSDNSSKSIIITGAEAIQPSPTPTPNPTFTYTTPTPTATPKPTLAYTPTPTATSTATPTYTPTPTATSTLEPRSTGFPTEYNYAILGSIFITIVVFTVLLLRKKK